MEIEEHATAKGARAQCIANCDSVITEIKNEPRLARYFDDVSRFAAFARRGWRIAIASLLYTGIGLLSFVLGQNIYQVGKYWFATQSVTTVYEICGECDLDKAGVDQLVDDIKHATLSRGEQLDLFRAQFEKPADAKLSESCAIAILDRARDTIGED